MTLVSRRSAIGALAVAPVAFAALLVVQAMDAMRGEYLPTEPGYRVDALVGSLSEAGVNAEPLRLVMLGDSTVAGVGSPTASESLAVLVADRVAAATGRPVQVTGLGVSGARTADLPTDQVAGMTALDPDVVVAVVGSNDVTHLTAPWALRRQIGALRDAVAERTDAPLVLAGIPLFDGATALARPLRDVVRAYAGVLRPAQRAAATADGIAYVDIARDASPRFAGVPDAMSADGFHPAPVGYGFWADAIAPVVLDALASTPPPRT